MSIVKNIKNTSEDKTPTGMTWREATYYALKDKGVHITRSNLNGKDGAHVNVVGKPGTYIAITSRSNNNPNNTSKYNVAETRIVSKSDAIKASKKHSK
jgi:hypothetical protein